MLGLKLCLSLSGGANGSNDAFEVTLTGLSDNEARIGTHASISYTINPDNGTDTVKWSSSSNPADAATYGTGANPTDFTAGDEGRLYIHVTDGGETVTKSAPIRYAAGASASIADGVTWTVDEVISSIDGSASGANLTWTYALASATAGVSINPSTGLISGTPTGVDGGTATVTATDQYGRQVSDTFTWTSALRAQATALGAIGAQNWTVDDTVINLNTATDFTTNGNTLTYVIAGLPLGAVDDGDGSISSTPTTSESSGSIVVTATDKYSRETTSTFSHTTSFRTQATAADGLGPFDYIIDDSATISINFVPDFTLNGNNPVSYVITGLPTGGVDDTDGTASGTATTAGQSGSIVCTMTDEYGRQTTSTAAMTTAYRTQAVGGADLDLGFPEDSAIATTNLLANWTLNGNTPTTLISVTPTLPMGLSAAIGGGTVQLTGTPTDITADNTYTVTMADEYSRQTSDTFTLEITSSDVTKPTIVVVQTATDGTYADITFSEAMDQTAPATPAATAFTWAQVLPTNTPVSSSVAWQSPTVLRVNVSPPFLEDE